MAQDCSLIVPYRQLLETGITLLRHSYGKQWRLLLSIPASAFWPSSYLREHISLHRARKTSAENDIWYEQTNFSRGTIQLMKTGVRIRKGCTESQVTTKWKKNKVNPAERQKWWWSIPIVFEFVNILVYVMQIIHIAIWLGVIVSTFKEQLRAKCSFHLYNPNVNVFS